MTSDFVFPKQKPREDAIAKLSRFLAALPMEKSWRVTVAKNVSKRSVYYNRYLFGCAYKLLSEHTGYLVDDIHEYACMKFFGSKSIKCPRTENNPGGVKDVPVRTTTRNETGHRDVVAWDVFDDFVGSVQQLGSDAGVYIPDPDPDWRENAA